MLLTGVPTRSYHRTHDRAPRNVLLDIVIVSGLFEDRRSLHGIDDAQKDDGIGSAPLITAIGSRDVQHVHGLSSNGQHVRTGHEDLTGGSINPEDSRLVSGHNPVRHLAKDTRIRICGHHGDNWRTRGLRRGIRGLPQGNIVFPGIENRSIVIHIRQLHFDHGRGAQTSSIGGQYGKFVATPSLEVEFTSYANLPGSGAHFELGEVLESFAQGVVHHGIYATIRITGRNLK